MKVLYEQKYRKAQEHRATADVLERDEHHVHTLRTTVQTIKHGLRFVQASERQCHASREADLLVKALYELEKHLRHQVEDLRR